MYGRAFEVGRVYGSIGGSRPIVVPMHTSASEIEVIVVHLHTQTFPSCVYFVSSSEHPGPLNVFSIATLRLPAGSTCHPCTLFLQYSDIDELFRLSSAPRMLQQSRVTRLCRSQI